MRLSEITHRLTKEAIIRYGISEELILTFPTKVELRKYINTLSVNRCHEEKKYHLKKYNVDMDYTKNIKDTKRNIGREKALMRKLANV